MVDLLCMLSEELSPVERVLMARGSGGCGARWLVHRGDMNGGGGAGSTRRHAGEDGVGAGHRPMVERGHAAVSGV